MFVVLHSLTYLTIVLYINFRTNKRNVCVFVHIQRVSSGTSTIVFSSEGHSEANAASETHTDTQTQMQNDDKEIVLSEKNAQYNYNSPTALATSANACFALVSRMNLSPLSVKNKWRKSIKLCFFFFIFIS